MKAIVALTSEEHKQYSDAYQKLCDKTRGIKLFGTLARKPGYAHYTFSGTMTDELLALNPTQDDIIMLVDSGFSHFGATCAIDGKSFRGKVNID
jgi:hypothetical protein